MRFPAFGLTLILLLGGVSPAAADLKPETLHAFQRYVTLVEQRMDADERDDRRFLVIDQLSGAERTAADAGIRRGELFIRALGPDGRSQPPDIPGGMIHHWAGVVFVRRVTVSDAVRLLQDYDRHAEIYSPAVARSTLLARDGQQFRLYLRFYTKKVIAVTLDSEHDAVFIAPAHGRASSRIRSARIVEVNDAGKPTETKKAEGKGRGYMWRLNTYWRFAERDGGTWVQCESITLSSRIPFGFGWLLKPFVTEVPKESLTFTLETTRKALLKGVR